MFNMVSAQLALLILINVRLQGIEASQFGVLILCERVAGSPRSRLFVGAQQLSIWHSGNCSRRAVRGKVDDRLLRDHAKLWPLRGEKFGSLLSLREVMYACKRGGDVSVMRKYRSRSAKMRWRKIFAVQLHLSLSLYSALSDVFS